MLRLFSQFSSTLWRPKPASFIYGARLRWSGYAMRFYVASPTVKHNTKITGDTHLPVELLREVAKQTLPLTTADEDNIDKLRVLHAAGHIVAELPDAGSKCPVARVLSITEEGQKLLEAEKLNN